MNNNKNDEKQFSNAINKYSTKQIDDARKLYFKNWRKNNPDKVKKHNATFWEKKAKELIKAGENYD
ncbi:MAG: hypothetical protein Q4C44_00905 [bacterium]|nr:hypothetical protein [bacterium]